MFYSALFCCILILCTVGFVDASQIDQALADLCGSSGCGTRTRDIKSTKLQIELEGAGFHRTLHYSTEVIFGGWSKPRHPCQVALLQPLPAVIYANIYELDNAYTAGKGPKVQLFGTVDVESIEKFAAPSTVALFGELEFSDSQSSSARVNLSLPLHGRYPKPKVPKLDNAGILGWKLLIAQIFENIELEQPEVLIQCLSEQEAAKGQAWRRIQKIAAEKVPTWPLPAGNLALAKATAIVTATVLLVALVIVLQAVFSRAKDEERDLVDSDRKVL